MGSTDCQSSAYGLVAGGNGVRWQKDAGIVGRRGRRMVAEPEHRASASKKTWLSFEVDFDSVRRVMCRRQARGRCRRLLRESSRKRPTAVCSALAGARCRDRLTLTRADRPRRR